MPEKASFKSITALVIDDNEHMLKIASTFLRAFGFGRILTASSALEGFEMFRDTPVDLIIVDYHMPELNGVDLIEKVRTGRDSTNTFVPIIMLTAYAELAFICKARDIGVTEFMCKPLSPKGLYEKIVTVIEHPRQFVKVDGYFGPDRRRRRDKSFNGVERRLNQPPAQTVRIHA